MRSVKGRLLATTLWNKVLREAGDFWGISRGRPSR